MAADSLACALTTSGIASSATTACRCSTSCCRRKYLHRNPHLAFSETVQDCPADLAPEPLEGARPGRRGCFRSAPTSRRPIRTPAHLRRLVACSSRAAAACPADVSRRCIFVRSDGQSGPFRPLAPQRRDLHGAAGATGGARVFGQYRQLVPARLSRPRARTVRCTSATCIARRSSIPITCRPKFASSTDFESGKAAWGGSGAW